MVSITSIIFCTGYYHRGDTSYVQQINMMNSTLISGIITRGARTLKEVAAAGVSIKKELRTTLSTSDQLKLFKSVREGGSDKFSFFETTGSIGSDIKVAYDLHMRVEALSNTLVLHDLIDVFKILDEATVSGITVRLEDLYGYEDVLKKCEFALLLDPTNKELLAEKSLASANSTSATSQL